MSELAERIKEVRGSLGVLFGKMVGAIQGRYMDEQDRIEVEIRSVIEQALLAERRLAMEECAEIAQGEPRCWDASAPDPQTRIAAKIRELDGVATPRGGE